MSHIEKTTYNNILRHSHYQLIFLVMVCVLSCLFSSCSDENTVSEDTQDFSITVSTRASALPDANLLDAGERVINTVRIYAFDGARLDQMYYVDNIKADGACSVTLHKLKRYSAKKFYVIINESPALKTTLDDVNTVNQLHNVKFEMSTYVQRCVRKGSASYGFPSGFELPMYGESDYINISESGTTGTTIYVDRTVARIDVVVKRNTTNAIPLLFRDCYIQIKNSLDAGYLLPTNVMQGTHPYTSVFSGSIDNFTLTNGKTAKFTFYVPEKMCTTDDERISIRFNDLVYKEGDVETSVVFPILLKEVKDKDGVTKIINKIERNNLYIINVNFNEHYPIQFSATVSPWEVVDENVIM